MNPKYSSQCFDVNHSLSKRKLLNQILYISMTSDNPILFIYLTIVGFWVLSHVFTTKVAKIGKWFTKASVFDFYILLLMLNVRHAYMSIKPLFSSSTYSLSFGLSALFYIYLIAHRQLGSTSLPCPGFFLSKVKL